MSGRLWQSLLIILGTLDGKKPQLTHMLCKGHCESREKVSQIQSSLGTLEGAKWRRKKQQWMDWEWSCFFLVQSTESSGYNCCDVEENVKMKVVLKDEGWGKSVVLCWMMRWILANLPVVKGKWFFLFCFVLFYWWSGKLNVFWQTLMMKSTWGRCGG